MQSVPSIYGTQSSESHTTTRGVFAEDRYLGPVVLRGAMSSFGTQASRLALRLAPPPPPVRTSAWNIGVLFVIGLLGFVGVSLLVTSMPGDADAASATARSVLGIVVLCAVPALFVTFVRKNHELRRRYEEYTAAWPAMTHVWQNSMACLRCHLAFFPAGVLGTGPVQTVPVDAFQAAVADLGMRLAGVGGPPPAPPLRP